ncbi:MAG: hypothetical protein ABS68_07075, partial [Niastella sp. SCN 39-18]
MYNDTFIIKKIIVLIPLYNEEDNVFAITQAVDNVFKNIAHCCYEIFFIDDGSTDKTLSKVKILEAKYRNISYLSFSRNFGKDVALLAGFQHISPAIDAVITLDSDLEHPPDLITDLIEQWQKGYDLVYAYRKEKNRNTSSLSNASSKIFYWVISKLADVKLENGISDFKLIDKKVLSVIKTIHEDNPFFRGLFKWVGFKQIGIPYSVGKRVHGTSKYSNKALIRLALNSITSFSTKPLTIAIYIGFFASLISILYIQPLFNFLSRMSISFLDRSSSTYTSFQGSFVEVY